MAASDPKRTVGQNASSGQLMPIATPALHPKLAIQVLGFSELGAATHMLKRREKTLMRLFCIMRTFCSAVALLFTASITNAQVEQVVDVDGYAMQVMTVGLDSRVPGQPVVVFENGSVSQLEHWGDLPIQVGAFAPGVA